MLTIRKEQVAVLAAEEMKKFEDRLLVHVKKCFSEQFEAEGEAKIRKTVQYGVQRAAAHRFSSERDICKYIDLMLAFGSDFDRSSWASSALDNPEKMGPKRRVKQLFKAAMSQGKTSGASLAK
jgi:hypothetical protein